MILITGDVHGEKDYSRLEQHHLIKKLKEKDFLIICGDLGIGFDNFFLERLKEKKYTTLFIDGNHENFEYLNSFKTEKWHNGYVHKIANNVIHLQRGQIFNIENKTFFTFGGAKSIENNNRIENVTWFPLLEEGNIEEMKTGNENLKKHGYCVDYILTHTCSSTYIQILPFYLNMFLEDSKTSIYLENIEKQVEYKHWFFGHFHEDICLDDKTTLIFKHIFKIKEDV